MGFDGRRADHQPSGDLGVIQTFDHQSQHNPLALRQIVARRGRLVGRIYKRLGSLWRQGGAPRVRCTDGSGQFIRRHIFEQIANRPGLQRVLDQPPPL